MHLRISRASIVVLASASIIVGACSAAATPSPAGTAAPGTAAPTSDSLAGQKVTVIATWTGDEEKAFRAMVAPWEQKTGATVSYTGTRDINTILATGVASGVLPDLAGLPGPGQMQEYYAAGALKTLDGAIDLNAYKADTASALVTLGTTPDGKIGGVFIKAAVKGLIWYNPKLHDYSSGAPKTWDELKSMGAEMMGNAQAQWCIGIESGAASGWPGTDWIEDFVLRIGGPQVYADWAAGKVPFTDPKIKAAWEQYGDAVAHAYGGPSTVITTAFQTAGDPLFTDPPGCEFHHQASFITGLGAFKPLAAGTDYNFFPFPDVDPQFSGAVEGAADLFGMFHDTPAAKSLMAWLVTPEAQNIWVKLGGALSANKRATDYPDDISKRSAELLINAKIFAFDASDLMPNQLQSAFLKGIVDYSQDASKLDSILAGLDEVQKAAY